MQRLDSFNKVAGLKQTRAAVLSGKAAVVYLAMDSAPNIVDEVSKLCCGHGVEIVSVGTRRELAKACRIDVPCAVAAALK